MITNGLEVLFELDPEVAFDQNPEWVTKNYSKWVYNNRYKYWITLFNSNFKHSKFGNEK